jgi:hypothetical protein
MEEQRQTSRIPFGAAIEQLITTKSDYPKLGGDDTFVGATALNLSKGGLACESAMMLEPLSQVYLIFSIPAPGGGERRIRCEGYVAHSACEEERCVFGIRFHDLSREDQAAIDAYVDAHDGK